MSTHVYDTRTISSIKILVCSKNCIFSYRKLYQRTKCQSYLSTFVLVFSNYGWMSSSGRVTQLFGFPPSEATSRLTTRTLHMHITCRQTAAANVHLHRHQPPIQFHMATSAHLACLSICYFSSLAIRWQNAADGHARRAVHKSIVITVRCAEPTPMPPLTTTASAPPSPLPTPEWFTERFFFGRSRARQTGVLLYGMYAERINMKWIQTH